MVLTKEEKQKFIQDGFIILQGAVPKNLIKEALDHANQAFADKQYKLNDHDPNDVVPVFHDCVQNAPQIGKMLESTILLEACEDLIGKENCRWGRFAQIVFRPYDKGYHDRGMEPSSKMPSHRYHCDGCVGKYRKTGTSFTVLVGICLSEGQDVDELRGQLNVWPGSHYILHDIIKERVEQGLVDGYDIFGYGAEKKPKIGDPVRVLLKPGDAVIAHQRLGHAGGINLHEKTRKNLYFRIKHRRHDELLPEILRGTVFTEFDGLEDLL